MSRDPLNQGRVAQKRRTRQALLAAGLQLLERGEEPSLDSVAAEADVSRATAYRYFPNIDALLAVLPLARLVDDPRTILGDASSDDPTACALRVQKYFYDLAVNQEVAFRRFIKATLEETLRADHAEGYEPLRGGFRLRALDDALASLEAEVDSTTLTNLRVALVALTGIESLLAVKDVCGLTAEEGWLGLEWAARALVETAQREAKGRTQSR